MSDLLWIDHPDALRELLERLEDTPCVALDTESNSMHAYAERVCLVQLSIPEEGGATMDAIIDPLAVDIEPLGALLEDAGRRKILHGADYDILSLKRDYGFSFANLFDTMIAARVLGWPQYGLGPILSERFDVRPDKRFQRHDWGKRPLPTDAVEYARNDTCFLPALSDQQVDELQSRDRLDLFLHACERQTRVEPQLRAFDPDGVWRVKGVTELDPQGQAVAKAVFVHREEVARGLDRPVFKVMGDATLIELARRRPRSAAGLRQVAGMGRLWAGGRGHALARVIAGAMEAEPPVMPRPPAGPPRRVKERYETLRRWRRTYAEQHGFEPDVVLSKQTLWALAEAAPRDMQALAAVDALDAWERTRYGVELLQVIGET